MLSGHVIGLLKEYMQDLVEQAGQEASAQERFGFTATAYRPDHAISDLLALLDDRIESEGMQVGLPDGFLHEMWSLSGNAALIAFPQADKRRCRRVLRWLPKFPGRPKWREAHRKWRGYPSLP